MSQFKWNKLKYFFAARNTNFPLNLVSEQKKSDHHFVKQFSLNFGNPAELN